MLHDHDDKFDNADEPEYHFSGDEDNEIMEGGEPAKPAPSLDGPTTPPPSEKKRPTPSKRMILSIVIFLVLVFVVYKMVVPSVQTSGTEMSAVPVPSPKAPMSSTMAPSMQPNVPTSPNAAAPSAPSSMSQQIASPTTAASPPLAAAPATMPEAAPVSAPPVSESTLPQQPGAVSPAQTESTAPALTVVPGTAPATTSPGAQAGLQQPSVPVFAANSNEAKMIELEAESARLLNQMNTEYTQKLNDFSTQNQALQDQMQTLNARVLSMETQLNQLVQTLTRQPQQSGNMQNNTASDNATSAAQSAQQAQAVGPAEAVVEPRTLYTVQAIIPGRAWLKSENGDIVTVAEGDMIRNLGRVTKIDPYDGIVEVSTGNKTISLSYGTGG